MFQTPSKFSSRSYETVVQVTIGWKAPPTLADIRIPTSQDVLNPCQVQVVEGNAKYEHKPVIVDAGQALALSGDGFVVIGK